MERDVTTYAVVHQTAPLPERIYVRKLYEGDEMSSIGWCVVAEGETHREAMSKARIYRACGFKVE
jgi:hypothetical protein